MNIELARVKLRGVYALIAGVILLLVVPLFQSALLIPAGYTDAIQAIVAHSDFQPLVMWLSQHLGLDIAFHILELAPFLLAMTVPGSLRRVLWPQSGLTGLVMMLCGQIGFACFAIAGVVGILTSASAAHSYSSATTAAQRSAAVATFTNAYAITTIISSIIGGLLLAVFLLLVSLRQARTQTMPRLFSYYGVLVAALLTVTAAQFAGKPAQAETASSPLSLAGLALWLIVLGLLLARLRTLAAADAQPTDATGEPPSDASHNSDAAVTRRQSPQ